jgi:hypothetical protein
VVFDLEDMVAACSATATGTEKCAAGRNIEEDGLAKVSTFGEGEVMLVIYS